VVSQTGVALPENGVNTPCAFATQVLDSDGNKKGKNNMAIKVEAIDAGRVLEVTLTGRLVKADYETFVPAVERLVEQHGKIRLLVVMHDFHGWTAGAMWADTKFAAHHFRDIERLAIVGETKWQHGMAVFCKPFTKAQIRYFDQGEADKARAWLEEMVGETAGAHASKTGIS
jgi:hypothetical protein